MAGTYHERRRVVALIFKKAQASQELDDPLISEGIEEILVEPWRRRASSDPIPTRGGFLLGKGARPGGKPDLIRIRAGEAPVSVRDTLATYPHVTVRLACSMCSRRVRAIRTKRAVGLTLSTSGQENRRPICRPGVVLFRSRKVG